MASTIRSANGTRAPRGPAFREAPSVSLTPPPSRNGAHPRQSDSGNTAWSAGAARTGPTYLVSDGCELRAVAQETMRIDVRVPNEVLRLPLLIVQVKVAAPNVLDVEVEAIGEAECQFLTPPSR